MKAKILALFFLVLTINIEADYNSLARAVLKTDWEQVITDIPTVELSAVHKQNLYEISHDIIQTKRAHFTFDWLKAFLSTKLLYSAFVAASCHALGTKLEGNMLLQRVDPDFYKRFSDIAWPRAAYSFTKIIECIALSFCTSAILDGNTYYQELQQQLTDAEAIKLVLMNSLDA